MKFVDEYRDPKAVEAIVKALRHTVTKPWTIMEVCGGQTRSIIRNGLLNLLPSKISIAHGPGCPVCVTPEGVIDQAIAIARNPEVILCSFGDMMRVPGSAGDLLRAKSEGADVRVVYSPMDALALANRCPDRLIVFLAVGFETTIPSVALTIARASVTGCGNFFVLVSHFAIAPAMKAVLSDPQSQVDAFLAAGHVCAVTGKSSYNGLAKDFGVPIVISGFEPFDILQSIFLCTRQLELGQAQVINQYSRVVRDWGNLDALALICEIFEICSRSWRGLGEIDGSGFKLRSRYARFDANSRFPDQTRLFYHQVRCPASRVLMGRLKPYECREFGINCTPDHPLGAPMVSDEGACASYFYHHTDVLKKKTSLAAQNRPIKK